MSTVEAHPVPEEDPEQNIGDVILDPWEDPAQPDWPLETVDLADEDEEV